MVSFKLGKFGLIRSILGTSRMGCISCARHVVVRKGLAKMIYKAAVVPLKGSVVALTLTTAVTTSAGTVSAMNWSHTIQYLQQKNPQKGYSEAMKFQMENAANATQLYDYLVTFCYNQMSDGKDQKKITACVEKNLARQYKGQYQNKVQGQAQGHVDTRVNARQ